MKFKASFNPTFNHSRAAQAQEDEVKEIWYSKPRV